MEPIEAQPAPADLSALWQEIDAFLNYILAERQLSQHTSASYRNCLTKFALFVAGGGVKDYARPWLGELRCFVRSLATARMSPSTINQHISAVKSLYEFLALEERADNGPARLLEQTVEWQRVPDVPSAEKVDRVLEGGVLTRYPLRDAAIVEFLYATGARVSELCDLELHHVEIGKGECYLFGKGRKERIALIGDKAMHALGDYLSYERPRMVRRRASKRASSPWVFVSRSGGRLARETVWKIVHDRGHLAGLESLHPHALRHLFATHCLRGGMDVRILQELLGHSSITTTARYTHVDTTSLKQVHASYHPRGANAAGTPEPPRQEAA